MSPEIRKHNPVQIILNSKDYIERSPDLDHRKSKDFYGNLDAEFATHKAKIRERAQNIGNALASSAGSKVTYVKAKLRSDAWAKSHRPTGALFKPQIFPSAGADGLGEPIFEVSAESISRLIESIESAEEESNVRVNPKTQKPDFDPSRARSEVGAIDDLIVSGVADKQSFSTDQALDWLALPGSGRFYVVSIFNPPMSKGDLLAASEPRQELYRDFVAGLNKLTHGVIVFRNSVAESQDDPIFIRPITVKRELAVADLFAHWIQDFAAFEFDQDPAAHDTLLRFLSAHPIVRRVSLPPLLSGSQPSSGARGAKAQVPAKIPDNRYPRVGIIDSGVAAIYDPWVIGRTGYLIAKDRDEFHGTFISGLLVGARAAGNVDDVAKEADGCELFDLDIFPDHTRRGLFDSYYDKGFLSFLLELDNQISLVKDRHQVRIFNLSINVEQEVDENVYGSLANELDKIAIKHDVIIVISSGNLPKGLYRAPWPTVAEKVGGHLLARAGSDRIYQPSESVYAICVGAINPPGKHGHHPGAPAAYARRGPGMKVGIKPDLAHFGGANHQDSGIRSIDSNGNVISGMGSSYAAPLVAKTLATIESRVQGYLSREALVALMVHKASVPGVLRSKELQTIAKQFVGFGVPPSAEDILHTEPNAITMVFESTLLEGLELRFPFAWPKSLVKANGACQGKATMTLVYRPILEPRFGAEFVRVNIDAFLRQSSGNGSWKGHATQVYMTADKKDVNFEKDLIAQGLKWWPIKHYAFESKQGGTGESSDWVIVAKPLVRDGTAFPRDGVPFALILTITHPDKEYGLFDEMKLWLSSSRVEHGNIQTAARILANP